MTAEIAPSPLRAVGRPVVDVQAAAVAVEDLMRALGMDTEDPGLLRTPARVASAYAEMLAPREFSLTTFPNDEGYDELVVARDIPFTSLCEHHLLPFVGTASVGYPARQPHPRPVEACASRRALLPAAAGPGAVDEAGCGLAGRPPEPTRCRRRDAGRAQLHDVAGCSCAGLVDGDQRDARNPSRRSPDPQRVLVAGHARSAQNGPGHGAVICWVRCSRRSTTRHDDRVKILRTPDERFSDLPDFPWPPAYVGVDKR